jgi:hypothetical protein
MIHPSLMRPKYPPALSPCPIDPLNFGATSKAHPNAKVRRAHRLPDPKRGGGLCAAARRAEDLAGEPARDGLAARPIVHRVDDLAGEPAQQAVPARPGVMARLVTVEDRTAVLANRVGDTGPIAPPRAQDHHPPPGRL